MPLMTTVTQHPPMHQLWMRLFWLFWDEPKPFSLNQTKPWGGFFFLSLVYPFFKFQKKSTLFLSSFSFFFSTIDFFSFIVVVGFSSSFFSFCCRCYRFFFLSFFFFHFGCYFNFFLTFFSFSLLLQLFHLLLFLFSFFLL
jgi:hypothetical protein